MLKLALASPPFAGSLDGALSWVRRFVAEAAASQADIVCFPEAYLPGLRMVGFAVDPTEPADLLEARQQVCELASEHRIHVILSSEWCESEGLVITAFVISDTGEILGSQSKTQIAPEEDEIYVPGNSRSLFSLKGIPFGIAICHEGWRYPETVRWAAARGAKIVFHPTFAGSNRRHAPFNEFGATHSPYYEKAMMCRALENDIYFASVNYALDGQEAATAVIAPDGVCLAHLPYGKAGLLIADVDPQAARGLYATRFRPERYPK